MDERTDAAAASAGATAATSHDVVKAPREEGVVEVAGGSPAATTKEEEAEAEGRGGVVAAIDESNAAVGRDDGDEKKDDRPPLAAAAPPPSSSGRGDIESDVEDEDVAPTSPPEETAEEILVEGGARDDDALATARDATAAGAAERWVDRYDSAEALADDRGEKKEGAGEEKAEEEWKKRGVSEDDAAAAAGAATGKRDDSFPPPTTPTPPPPPSPPTPTRRTGASASASAEEGTANGAAAEPSAHHVAFAVRTESERSMPPPPLPPSDAAAAAYVDPHDAMTPQMGPSAAWLDRRHTSDGTANAGGIRLEDRLTSDETVKSGGSGGIVGTAAQRSGVLLGELSPLRLPEPASAAASAERKAGGRLEDDGGVEIAIASAASKVDETFLHAAPSGSKKIRLGICAMDKKARSKPMAEILSRLDETLFDVVFFGDKMILTWDVEDWPVVDVLIAFYSSGYPLEKAERYADLRKPFVLNDLKMQTDLLDRRRVYDLLEASGIDVPRHVYMSRDGYGGVADRELIEHDDHIEVHGIVINKPFVEKPVDADDHNIAIYYPTSAGGGCKKLFRKIGDRSSEFYPDVNEVRRDGSYIYEEFVETQGTDVKMYTVGPDYGHAEARKSPTVDGKVERNSDGKEVRFPVILTLREKEIARRIVLVFKQQVCGFDLLRVQEGDSLVSYVCDVNGWSFVKNSRKYYDDCAQILTEHMLAAVKPKALKCFSTLNPLMTTMEDDELPQAETPTKKQHRHQRSHHKKSTLQRVSSLLQGVDVEDAASPAIAVDDSSNRSPIRTSDDAAVDPTADPVLRSPMSAATTLEEGAPRVRDMPDKLSQEPASLCTSANSSVVDENERRDVTSLEKGTHQEELRCVICVIRHGDRTPKQKLKVKMTEPGILKYFHDHTDGCWKDLKVKAKKPMLEFLNTVRDMIAEKEESVKDGQGGKDVKKMLYKLRHMRDVLERWKIGGLNRKLQIKPQKWTERTDENGETVVECTLVQLILKWGGNLTKLGERQAITLGQRLRHEMYPDAPGGGILRLHSTFRHDLKIKTSDEGRVMKTAAAFAKGLLELEGEIPPILVSLVHKERDSMHMLDPSGNKEVRVELDECKEKINANLQKDFDYDRTTIEEHESVVGPASLGSTHTALKKVGNPRRTLFAIHRVMGELLEQLDEMLGSMASGDENRMEGEGLQGENEEDEALSGIKLYKGETLLELTERWRLLHKKMYDEEHDLFDLSRVPDVHDNVRFDMLHNPHLGLTETLENLYELAKLMADCVVPQEYGTTIEEKRSIGNKMCRALLEKIKYDLIIARTDNQVDMRYMINMDYSADLPINTMGRRIRTRLYFTSESHLHTLLNVLRFPSANENGKPCLLSKHGRDVINGTAELCYLTQVCMRLFEDVSKKDLDDPKRFRVEMLFSPGATAPPLHMALLDRDLDSTRFDTDGLVVISKDNLTCKEVEEYFTESIREGRTEDDPVDDTDAAAKETRKSLEKAATEKSDEARKAERTPKQAAERTPKNVASTSNDPVEPVASGEGPKLEKSTKEIIEATGDPGATKNKATSTPNHQVSATARDKSVAVISDESNLAGRESEPEQVSRSLPAVDTHDDDEERERVEKMARVLARQYFWKSIAVVSFFLGVGCLVLSKGLRDNMQHQKRWRRR